MMRCIFCKLPSEDSVSVEHIIPESLGNTKHILPKGIVCDKCNNYFASKIEQPFLQLPYFISVRHRNDIESKKGRIPLEKGVLFANTPSIINIHRGKEGQSLMLEDESLLSFFTESETFSIIIPINEEPPKDNIFISKFLGKVGLELIAKIGIDVDSGIDEITDKIELDAIRNYVRYGKGVKFWQYYCRPLYNEQCTFTDETIQDRYQVLHEFKLLYTEDQQLLVIVVIFGIEYCLDLSRPTTEVYEKWLLSNNYVSPMYRPDRNAFEE